MADFYHQSVDFISLERLVPLNRSALAGSSEAIRSDGRIEMLSGSRGTLDIEVVDASQELVASSRGLSA
jgi:hypothetical protein